MPCFDDSEIKILAVSSFGGHWIQLKRLMPFFDKYDTTYVSCFDNKEMGEKYIKIFDVNANSNKFFIFLSFIFSFFVLVKVRPDVIVSTGALPGLIFIAVGKKIFRVKTVWIDSVANGDELSKSGIVAKRFSDIYLTQWQHLESPDGPYFIGSVL